MFTVRKLLAEDWKAVRAIYQQGIDTRLATFETEVPTWEDWDRNHLETCRLVAVESKEVMGWAALGPVSKRSAYAGVASVSVYVADSAKGKGIGKSLLKALVEASDAEGIWTLEAAIFPENQISIALHKACGFREVGKRERIGQLDGIWRDTLLLERRSKIIGG
jgi:L-amino acid N-acyltransferase YncA